MSEITLESVAEAGGFPASVRAWRCHHNRQTFIVHPRTLPWEVAYWTLRWLGQAMLWAHGLLLKPLWITGDVRRQPRE